MAKAKKSAAKKGAKKTGEKRIQAIRHVAEKRSNIPTAESENMVCAKDARPIPVKYPRMESLNPQLEWAGKSDEPNPLTVNAMPIYVQEKIDPQAIIDDLRRQTAESRVASGDNTANLFENFNGLHDPVARTEFYQHMQNWTNRMIWGDSLHVMTSLAKKESLSGKVQCIYIDPPYGIKFSSNWQHSTKTKTVKDRPADESREPEAIRAFRDIWELGVSSYLSYLRNRLTVARDLLTDSGSVFVQISDENVHFVRCVLDEIFGINNFIAQITFRKKNMPLGSKTLENMCDYLIWYAKSKDNVKYRALYEKSDIDFSTSKYIELPDGSRRQLTSKEKSQGIIPDGGKLYQTVSQVAPSFSETGVYSFDFRGKSYQHQANQSWITTKEKMHILAASNRLQIEGTKLRYVLFSDDFNYRKITNPWMNLGGVANKKYVVQTSEKVIQRCLLMTTDPGDLVLDPTCGSGTTAVVAEQWGRRWITIDTSRVSLAIARARMMSAKFDYYLIQDSKEGADKEAEISKKPHDEKIFGSDIRHGFVYKRVPHITLRAIVNNAYIGVICDRYRASIESLLAELNAVTGQKWQEWEVPAEAEKEWSEKVKNVHVKYIAAKRKRQKEINDAIAQNADTEFLHDQPYVKNNCVRVAGPFTVESLSPHRVLPVDMDELSIREQSERESDKRFWEIVRANLREAGVQNTKKNERLEFVDLEPWSQGNHIQFIGRDNKGKKIAVCIGPQYGTVSRSLLTEAAREASDYFDLLVVLGFAFEGYADDNMVNIGRLTVIRAHMNNDLRMPELKKSDGNLFVAFGEPDIKVRKIDDEMYEVKILGIDIYDPVTGETKASETDDIAYWFIDTDYNGESFFVRHVYFCGGFDKYPYGKLKKELNTEIDQEAWESLYSTVSRPFPKPKPKSEGGRGRIAVKAINHYGDEVMKVFDIE